MSIKLTGVKFGVSFIGDGTTTSLTVDLTKEAASLYPQNETVVSALVDPQFTPNFNINTATDVTGLVIGGPGPTPTISGSISSGKVILMFSPAPNNGAEYRVEGTLIF